MTTDADIRARIGGLVGEEKELRQRLAAGEISREEEHQRLRDLEAQLDQCWDLLRQREALRDAGRDENRAEVRSAKVVEDYLG